MTDADTKPPIDPIAEAAEFAVKMVAAQEVTDAACHKLFEEVAQRHKAAVLRIESLILNERYNARYHTLWNGHATRAEMQQRIDQLHKWIDQRDTLLARYEQGMCQLRQAMADHGMDVSGFGSFTTH